MLFFFVSSVFCTFSQKYVINIYKFNIIHIKYLLNIFFFISLQVKNHSNVNMKDVIEDLQTHQIGKNIRMSIHQISRTIVVYPDVINHIHIHHLCESTWRWVKFCVHLHSIFLLGVIKCLKPHRKISAKVIPKMLLYMTYNILTPFELYYLSRFTVA